MKIPKFLNKERSGFSGGFKIPQEQRRARLGGRSSTRMAMIQKTTRTSARMTLPKRR
jgi:hypothetical protein